VKPFGFCYRFHLANRRWVYLGRLDRMREADPAVALQPDALIIDAAVQLATATVLLYESVGGVEYFTAVLAELKPKTFALDGGVAVFDEQLVPRFELAASPEPRRPGHAASLHVFDLLKLGDKDYRKEPLKVRRKAL
jgi:hypothetical protein